MALYRPIADHAVLVPAQAPQQPQRPAQSVIAFPAGAPQLERLRLASIESALEAQLVTGLKAKVVGGGGGGGGGSWRGGRGGHR